MWCICRKQTLHIASYETVQYPTSQILHCGSISNRRIWLIFLDINDHTWIITYLKFKWNQTIFRKLSSQYLLKAFSYADNFKQLDGLHISIIVEILLILLKLNICHTQYIIIQLQKYHRNPSIGLWVMKNLRSRVTNRFIFCYVSCLLHHIW